MILNELLTKQNILSAILVKDESGELSKELKVKIVRLRIAYNKIKKQVDEDVQEFTKDLVPEELRTIQAKAEDARTEEEKARLEELVNKVNSEYNEFMLQKGKEEINFEANESFTEEEFDEIIGINAGNEVEINGAKIKSEELLDGFYSLFVNKN